MNPNQESEELDEIGLSRELERRPVVYGSLAGTAHHPARSLGPPATLARMARDFAAERRAAGRVVPDDVARLAPDVTTGRTA